MKKLFCAILAVLMLFALMTACSSGTPAATNPPSSGTNDQAAEAPPEAPEAPKSDPIVITFASFHSETELDTVNFTKPWLEAIEKACADAGYDVTFETYWGGTLISLPESYKGVVDGVADMAIFLSSMTPNFELEQALLFPWNGKDVKTPTIILETLYNEFPEIQAQYDEVQPIAVLAERPQYIYCNKLFSNKADSKGILWTSTGTVSSAICEEWGWSPVSLGPDELYSAFERGISDGVPTSAKTLIGNAWYEVLKYRYENLAMTNQMDAIIMNKNKWNSLPADVQEIFKDFGSGGIWNVGAFYDEALRSFDKEFEPKLPTDYGMEIITLSDEAVAEFQAGVDAAADKWAAAIDAQGKPGSEILARTRELIEQYAS